MMGKQGNFRFIKVGVAYGNLEFYYSFMCPYNLCMRRYNNGSMQKVSLDDWLQADFPSILGMRLHLLDCSHLRLVSISSFKPDRCEIVPIAPGNSLPDSWITPFINLIAETFLNTYYYEKK